MKEKRTFVLWSMGACRRSNSSHSIKLFFCSRVIIEAISRPRCLLSVLDAAAAAAATAACFVLHTYIGSSSSLRHVNAVWRDDRCFVKRERESYDFPPPLGLIVMISRFSRLSRCFIFVRIVWYLRYIKKKFHFVKCFFQENFINMIMLWMIDVRFFACLYTFWYRVLYVIV